MVSAMNADSSRMNAAKRDKSRRRTTATPGSVDPGVEIEEMLEFVDPSDEGRCMGVERVVMVAMCGARGDHDNERLWQHRTFLELPCPKKGSVFVT